MRCAGSAHAGATYYGGAGMQLQRLDRFILGSSLAYVLFGAVWIVGSDALLGRMLSVEAIAQLSMAKGLLFVVLSACGFALGMRHVRALVDSKPPPGYGFDWRRWQRWPGYLLALVLVCTVGYLRTVLLDSLGDDGHHHLLLIFVPVIFVSSLLGGWGPGLLSTAVAVLIAAQSLYFQREIGHGTGVAEHLQLFLLGVSGAAGSLISGGLHRAREAAERDAVTTASTLGAIGDGVVVLDAEHRVVSLNRAALQIIGCDQIAAHGQTLADLLGADIARVGNLPLHSAQATDYGMVNLTRADGVVMVLKVDGYPLLERGQRRGRVIVLRDETSRDALSREATRVRGLLTAIIEGSSDAIFVKDRNGRYLLGNAHCAEMLGYATDDLVGRGDADFFPAAQARMLQQIDSNILQEGTTRTGEEHLSLPGRPEVVFLATKGPVRDETGAVVGVFGISRDITERSQHERALARSRAQLHTFVEQAPISVAMFDREMRYLVASQRWRAGFASNEDTLIGRSHYDVLPDVPDHWRVLHARGLAGEHLHCDHEQWERSDGQRHWLRWAIQPWNNDNGDIGGIIIVAEDLTTQMRLLEQQRISAVALEAADAIVITDANTVVQQVNRAYCDITGYSADEAIGRRQGDLVRSEKQGVEFYRAMWSELATNGVWRGELWNRRKSGELYPQFLSITAVRDERGEVSHYVGVMQDITQRKRADETILRLAYYDALTDLPNRRLLLDHLQHALKSCEREGICGALLFIDLDNFKQINDTLGHDAGDELLIQVARRLQAAVRDTDTVARLGGDEFVVMLEHLSDEPGRAAALAGQEAQRISERIVAGYTIRGADQRSSASIGIALFCSGEISPESLMKQADLAMYQAKADGKNLVRFFDPAMQTVVESRSRLESELRSAVQRGQFTLHYQVQLHRDLGVVGVEALMRWQRDDGRLVSPAEFIPLAEETGLIVPMGAVALVQACRQLVAWRNDPDTCGLSIAVNVSARQFRNEDFVHQVESALQQTGADPQRIKLELTESLLLDQVDTAIARMHQLRAIGLVFSLDDFGTGFSSLSYLRRLPLEQLKIDRSFVTDLLSDSNAAAIARAIIHLAHSLGLAVVAEGVESEAVWDCLREEGCDIGQGYLFGRPLPAEAIPQHIRELKASHRD
ncbi:EAL domain-containing protein [Aquimonas sp.]|uniref:bifunctional diguanylate cyclase/phosphodiesterase n=1 Tax=Aquimonas sp. TaxID=1872588 RepID=UPI0037BF28FB